MHPYLFGWYRIKILVLSFLVLVGMNSSAFATFRAVLQGQSRSNTNWIAGNLQGWREMDAIPCRVYLTGGPAQNKQIVIQFDHLQAGRPAIENLSLFTPSTNVVITSAPILSAPAKSAIWSYTFKVNLLDGKPGHVAFQARLAAGAHKNVGSSVALRGTPALGTLQIHKPGVGVPDLTLTKSGASQAIPGDVITYTLNYSSKAGTAAADCVQIVDRLPSEVSIVRESVRNGGVVFGNTILWSLGTLAPGASGKLTYDVRVKADALCNVLFTNCAVITGKGDRHKPKDDDEADDDRDDKDNCHEKDCDNGDKCGSYPDANFADNQARVSTRTVCNAIPAAANDSYSILRDTLLKISAPGVLANDLDGNNDRLSALLLTGPLHGTLGLGADGSFTYQPATEFVGTDGFTYAASDGKASSTATVTIIVQAVNHAPVAANDLFHTQRDVPLIVAAGGILANDTDADGDVLTAILVTGPAQGVFALNSDGSFRYEPKSGFAGVDSFTYAARDGRDSSAAVVTIMVQAVNRSPVGAPDHYHASRNTSMSVGSPGVLANDSDPDGDALTATIATVPTHGAVTLAANGSFIYAPADGFTGTDTFAYVARDAVAQSVSTIVTIVVGGTNLPPEVSISAPTNGTIFVTGMDFLLSAEARDPDGRVTQVELSEGAASLGSFTEIPYAVRLTNVIAGEYVFRATATDNDGATAVSAPVSVTVLPTLPFAVGNFRLNRQTGLFEQLVRISNPTPQEFHGIRLRIGGVRAGASVWNKTAVSEGIPYIDAATAVPTGGYMDILVKYYAPDVRVAPTPIYLPELLIPVDGAE